MDGLNPEPCASYSLADRFMCAVCAGTPEVVSAEGRDPIQVKLRCCGREASLSVSRRELVFTQVVFREAGGREE